MEAEEQREIDDLLSRGTAARFGRRGRKSLYEAPEFTKRLSAFTEADAGTDVKFECQYKGFPRPTVKWYRDDESIPGEERYVFEDSDGFSSLSITKVGKFDEAAYKCKAENSEGVTSTTGYLSVTGDVSDKPLSCQGRQSEHAVSNPPPLRTIIEQKSMEEREEDAYPQPSTSPVDEILEEAALKGHGWPAMLGLKKRKEKRRQGNEEDYDSGSDTSVESQADERVDRERTPDADLVIDEEKFTPELTRQNANVNPAEIPQDVVMTNGTVAEQVLGKEQQITDSLTQQGGGPAQAQDFNQASPMDLPAEYQGMLSCQAPSESVNDPNQIVQSAQPELQSVESSNNSFVEEPNPPSYAQVMENNVVPEMQTAPAMASPNAVQMEFGKPPAENYQAVVESQMQQGAPQETLHEAMQTGVVPQDAQFMQVQQGMPVQSQQEMLVQSQQEMLAQPQHAMVTQPQQEMPVQSQQEMLAQPPQAMVAQPQQAMPAQPQHAMITQPQQEMLAQQQEMQSQPQPEPVQMEVVANEKQPNQMEVSAESRDDSPIGACKPETEKQKSIESGYSTEDLDAAVQQEAAVTYTETMEVPVVRSREPERANEQHATIFLGDSGQTTPEVMIGSPVNLQVSLAGRPGGLPLGIQLGGEPQINASAEPDGLIQQAPPEVVAEPVVALPQVYEPPTNFVSVEHAEVRHSPPRMEQQPQSPPQNISNEITEPQVFPQSTETVMSQPVVQSQERIEEDNKQYSSASNPFRASTDDTNDEVLASYTRTFSSTIEEEEQGQEVGEPLPSDEPIVRHTDEIITLATVQTTLPIHDSLPFPWLPLSLLVTLSTFIAVACEINPSTFVLVLFLVSFISFRFIVSREKPKDD